MSKLNKYLKEQMVPLICFMAAAFLLFMNTFGQQWTYDDYPVIVRNLDIRSLGNFLRDTYPGRPLRELTFMLDYTLFGFDPRWYHFQNIFWHALNAFLLFRLVRSLRGALWLAWTAGMIFLVHPLTVEVVANTSHRKDSLATAFCLLAALFFLRSYHGRRGWAWMLAALGCGVVACFAKQTGVGIFVVMLGYDLFLAPLDQRKLPIPARLNLSDRKLSCSLLALSFLALFAWYGWLINNQAFQLRITNSLQALGASDIGTSAYFVLVLKALSSMLLRVVWPVNLAIEYTFPFPDGFVDPWVLATLFLFVAAAFFLAVLGKRKSIGFLMLVWVVVFWVPTSNLLFPLAYFAADRYLYTPLAGFAVLAGLIIGHIAKGKATRLVTCSVLVSILAALSWQQVNVWESGKSLYAQAQKVSPSSVVVQEGLASEYINTDELDKALEILTPLHEKGNSVKSIYLLGLVYEKKGEIDKAISYYRKFLLINDPRYQKEVFGIWTILRKKYRVNL
jgi:tetratricopeptide (TPR) repeat protein